MMQVDVQEEIIQEKLENKNEIGVDLLLVIGYLKGQYKETKLLQLDSQSEIIHLIKLFSDYDPEQIECNYENGEEQKEDQPPPPPPPQEIIKKEPEPTPTPEPMNIIHESSPSSNSRNRIIRANKSMEPTVLLVDGYIREQSQILNLSITIVISDIIQQFYQKMKGTTFVWHITNKKSKLLTKILQSTQQGLARSSSILGQSQPYYDSDLFSVQTNLKNPSEDVSSCSFCDPVNATKIIGTLSIIHYIYTLFIFHFVYDTYDIFRYL